MRDPNEKERRADQRHSFEHPMRPTLAVGPRKYEVVDYSKNGIRISHRDPFPLSGWVEGVLCIPGREPIAIDAIVIRCEDGHVGLRLIAPISV